MIGREIKNLVRKEIRYKRENISLEEKKNLSTVITEKFFNLPEIEKADVIMSYMDFKNEVETRELNEKLIKLGKKVLIPRVSEDKEKIIPAEITGQYRTGNFGIAESLGKDFAGKKIDIVIVPGIAFNEKGARIGFGKGYYDKFLSQWEEEIGKILKVSLAYDFQIDNRFSGENHDKNIDMIITENRIIKLEY